MSSHQIRTIESDNDLERVFPVVAQLRTTLDYQTFHDRVLIQRTEGYRLVMMEDEDRVVAVAGFRMLHCLPLGRFMYIDDFVTTGESRKRGLGSTLFHWLEDHARQEGCKAIQLDSGLQRVAAQQFYAAMKMELTCNHFSKML